MYDRLDVSCKCNVLLPRVPNRVTGRDLLPYTKYFLTVDMLPTEQNG